MVYRKLDPKRWYVDAIIQNHAFAIIYYGFNPYGCRDIGIIPMPEEYGEITGDE